MLYFDNALTKGAKCLTLVLSIAINNLNIA